MNGKRYLIVTADDFGVGPGTTQGILDLAVQGRVTATVLLVNSPHAEPAVRDWEQAGRPVQLGWHPCLTLDRPILPAESVPSLVDAAGKFWPLGSFMARVLSGRIHAAEIAAELRAQFERFRDLVGQPPQVVNSHHHVQVFAPVGQILLDILSARRRSAYVRRVREPLTTLLNVPGARIKRALLSILGRRDARLQERAGFPGNEWLAGITDPPYVHDPSFLVRWLKKTPGQVVELTCHPGHYDPTLIGRDCTPDDGQLQRRVRELELLQRPSYLDVCREAGWALVSPAELEKRLDRGIQAA